MVLASCRRPPLAQGARLMAYRSFGVILADIIQATKGRRIPLALHRALRYSSLNLSDCQRRRVAKTLPPGSRTSQSIKSSYGPQIALPAQVRSTGLRTDFTLCAAETAPGMKCCPLQEHLSLLRCD